MSILNRLIARFNNPKQIASFQSQNPLLRVTNLYYFEPKTKYNRLSPTEQNLYNTVLITPASNGSLGLLKETYQKLTNNPSVAYVQYDQEYKPYAGVPNIESPTPWWFEDINFTQTSVAYNVAPGANVKVAIVDSGIDHIHPDLDPDSFDLAENRRDFADESTWYNLTPGNFIDQYHSDEVEYHGTHIAGIIASMLNNKYSVGIAHHAKLMNLRVFPNATESRLSVAIRYATDKNAQVINASWGAKMDPQNKNMGKCLQEIIQYACSKQTLVVCAAGNDDADVKDYIPAGFDNVITVGSIEKARELFKKSQTSNYGPNVIGAPGVNIQSLSAAHPEGMLPLSGTSMSAAFVSGLVARMLSVNPKLVKNTNAGEPCNIAAAILKHIIRSPRQMEDHLIGLGVIDVDNTLKNLPPP